MVIEPKLAAVDPIHLAEISGATKVRRFSAPTPPVIRPHLLTHQLRGDCCDSCATMGVPPDYGRLAGLRGLGLTLDPNTVDITNLQVPSAGSGNVSVLQAMAIGANFVPGVGTIASAAITTVTNILAQFENWLHIGAGRREADIIVPVQNQLMNALGIVTQQIAIGQNPSVDVLEGLYREVWTRAVAFQEFVLLRNFTDRRASGQALNTIMPYIDGSCGYAVPVGYTATPTQQNCLSWGSGGIGGDGTNGMLGSIGRAILARGGSLPVLPDLHQAANQGIKVSNPQVIPGGGVTGLPGTGGGVLTMGGSTPLMVIVGALAIFFFSKRGLF